MLCYASQLNESLLSYLNSGKKQVGCYLVPDISVNHNSISDTGIKCLEE